MSLPANELPYRAYNPETKDYRMLESPDLIEHFSGRGFILQKRNSDNVWKNVSDDPTSD
jgi:hypothetical protein